MVNPPLPSAIGRYRVDAVIGEGAMGVVYKGYDTAIERPVALKVVHAQLLRGQEAADYTARFRREAQAAGRCAHRNIVAVYDFAEHEGAPFIAMEYVEGAALERYIARGERFDVAQSLAVILQVLDALACAHAAGIIHRDIKPANIILLRDGAVKVADFGVSSIARPSVSPGASTDVSTGGTIVGTPSYMSLEQSRGDPVDPRSDLFSTGAVLFELLTGERAFAGGSFTQVYERLQAHEPTDLSRRLANVPDAVARAVLTALAKEPGARFRSALEMAAALRRASAAPSPGSEHTVLLRKSEIPAVQSPPSGARTGVPTAAAIIGDIPAASLAGIERALTKHLGPIARVMLKREITPTMGAAELCDRLTAYIEQPNERDEFRAAVRPWVSAPR